MTRSKLFFLFATIITCMTTCQKTSETKIEQVFIIVVDGVRNSDLYQDSLMPYTSEYHKLISRGVRFEDFYNDGLTLTQNGMSNIVTGYQETLTNNGKEISKYPNIFHHYLNAMQSPNTDAWIIASKDKLAALAETEDTNFAMAIKPRTDCGISGLGSGYRQDNITFERSKEIIATHKPKLAMIAFGEPDYSGHRRDWQGYKNGIKASFEYTNQLIDFVQKDPQYASNTLFIITNDHGRHLDGIADGYVSHGDNCLGCRKIMLIAISPKIKPQTAIYARYNLGHIAPSILSVLNISHNTTLQNPISEIE